MLPVVENLSTSNLHSNDLNSKFKGLLFVSPGLRCVNYSQNLILGTGKDANGKTITNCEYYSNLRKDDGDGIFGCIKCKYGFIGII